MIFFNLYQHSIMGNVCVPIEQEPVVCPHKKNADLVPSKGMILTQFNANNVCDICQGKSNYKMKISAREFQPRKTELTITTQNVDQFKGNESIEKIKNLTSNKKTMEDFQVVRGLGKGGFGKVYLIRQKRNEQHISNDKNIMSIQNQERIEKQEEGSPEQLIIDHIDIVNQQKQDTTLNNTSRRQSKFKSEKNQSNLFYQKNNKPQKYFALKIMPKNSMKSFRQKQQALSQRLILESVEHPFIIKLHYAFQTKSRLFLIVDLLRGGQLFYLLRKNGRFSQQIVRFYAGQILLALEYLHSKNIIYRDLKPQNILLDLDGHLRITDFGLSKMLYSSVQKTYSFCGTPQYIAPQIIAGKGYNQVADWFSFGSLLYDMLTGSPPFQSKNKKQIMQKILTRPILIPQYLSDSAKSLLRGLFKLKPSERLGNIRGAAQIKEHQFFKDLNFEALFDKQIEPPFNFYNKKGDKDEQFFINDSGFQYWNSWQKNIDSPKKTKPNQQHFSGFSYGIQSFQLQGISQQKRQG